MQGASPLPRPCLLCHPLHMVGMCSLFWARTHRHHSRTWAPSRRSAAYPSTHVLVPFWVAWSEQEEARLSIPVSVSVCLCLFLAIAKRVRPGPPSLVSPRLALIGSRPVEVFHISLLNRTSGPSWHPILLDDIPTLSLGPMRARPDHLLTPPRREKDLGEGQKRSLSPLEIVRSPHRCIDTCASRSRYGLRGAKKAPVSTPLRLAHIFGVRYGPSVSLATQPSTSCRADYHVRI